MCRQQFLAFFALTCVLATPAWPSETATVIRVIDGDTLVVDIDGREERVRLIGVDTPETVHPKKPVEYFGKEASAFTKRMVEGKTVRLETSQGVADRDRYKRLLRYVYLPDGKLLNAEIIAQGYGFAYTRYPFDLRLRVRRASRAPIRRATIAKPPRTMNQTS